MAKKIKFESFKYRFLVAAREFSFKFNYYDNPNWILFIENLTFEYDDNTVNISWSYPISGTRTFSLRELKFYARGDRQTDVKEYSDTIVKDNVDSIKENNEKYFNLLVKDIASSVGYNVGQ